MLFDLNRLHGEREHLERTLQPSVFAPQDGDEYRVSAPVRLVLDVEKAGGDAYNVRGRLQSALEADCSRCLDPVPVPVDIAFDLRYLPQAVNAGQGEREIDEDDLATAYHRDGVLDLVELVREQFQLALPMKPLCSDACQGLCPECGANRNRGACGHSSSWGDPRLAALKGLLDRSKEN